MAARALPESQIEQLAAEGAAQLRRERAASMPPVINAALATGLDEPDVLHWRGRRYTVPPIPYDRGADLIEIQAAIARIAAAHAKRVEGAAPPATLEQESAEWRQWRTLVGRAVAIFPELVRGRFMWFRPNPFRSASASEVGALLDFFSACQTRRSGAPSPPRPAAASPHRST